MRIGILDETTLFLVREGEIATVLGLIGQKVDGDPGRIAHEVDQPGDFGLHCSNALNSGRAVANDCNTLVGPVIVVVPADEVGQHIMLVSLNGSSSLPLGCVDEFALEIRDPLNFWPLPFARDPMSVYRSS